MQKKHLFYFKSVIIQGAFYTDGIPFNSVWLCAENGCVSRCVISY